MSTKDFNNIAQRFDLSIDVVIKIYNSLKPVFQTSQVSELITQIDSITDTEVNASDINFTNPSDQRYQEVGVLGVGGMGEVFRVKDTLLRRVIALKTIQPNLQSNPILMQRFVQEACLTAQLQHPNIVPVHDIGMRADGTLYFTMREIAGHNLEILIRDLHNAVKDGEWWPFGKGWSFRRVIDSFRRAVEAVAYAHSREVIHRDLKPANIMLGAHGEVLVVDWGLAIHLPSVLLEEENITTGGTPIYMSPEQYQNKKEALKETSDVWSLGCMLFEILLGKPPFNKQDLVKLASLSFEDDNHEFQEDLRARLVANTIGAPKSPSELIDLTICMLQPNIKSRLQSAEEVLTALTDWLDGARRSEAAKDIIAQAEDIGMAAQMAAEQAYDVRTQIHTLEQSISTWAEDKDKQQIWELQDLAENLEAQSLRKKLQMEELLNGALTHDPNNTLAHLLLSQQYHAAHKQAELNKDHIQSMYYASRLQYHTECIPKQHPAHRTFIRYLTGLGSISLDFQPHNVRLKIEQVFPDSRVHKSANVIEIPQPYLKQYEIGMGSYILRAEAEGYSPLIYPIYIDRLRHWKNNPPNLPTKPVRLLRNTQINSTTEVYIPAGWFLCGGDPLAIDSTPQENIWLDGFIIQKTPVSLRQYTNFLNHLLNQNRDREADSYLPTPPSQRRHFSIIKNGNTRTYRLYPDADGDIWNMRWPVFYIDHNCIEAYIKWLKDTTGVQWRLPTAQEWEKAARGVDGRYYPWGDYFDSAWSCMRDSHRHRPLPEPIGSRPKDTSLYGVIDMGGGISEYTSSRYFPNQHNTRNSKIVTKGGSWRGIAQFVRVSSRGMAIPSERSSELGFRLVRDLPHEDKTG